MNGAATHGMWSDGERKDHINVLKLKAALFGIQSLCRDLHHCHIRIEIDNTTAVSYINHMGGTHSFACNALLRNCFYGAKLVLFGSRHATSQVKITVPLIATAEKRPFTLNGL